MWRPFVCCKHSFHTYFIFTQFFSLFPLRCCLLLKCQAKNDTNRKVFASKTLHIHTVCDFQQRDDKSILSFQAAQRKKHRKIILEKQIRIANGKWWRWRTTEKLPTTRKASTNMQCFALLLLHVYISCECVWASHLMDGSQEKRGIRRACCMKSK